MYDLPVDVKYPRNIFVLTDGEIHDTELVMKKVRENNNFTRVHSFGIGDRVSTYLVKELSKAGLGTSALNSDKDPKIKDKVIQALNQAARPAFTDMRVDWSDNEGAVNFQAPRAPVAGFIYEEGKI